MIILYIWKARLHQFLIPLCRESSSWFWWMSTWCLNTKKTTLYYIYIEWPLISILQSFYSLISLQRFTDINILIMNVSNPNLPWLGAIPQWAISHIGSVHAYSPSTLPPQLLMRKCRQVPCEMRGIYKLHNEKTLR